MPKTPAFIPIHESISKLLAHMDICGLMLFSAGRKSGDFRHCGMFTTLYGSDIKKAKLQHELKAFCKTVKKKGLPFEKTRNGDAFVVTII